MKITKIEVTNFRLLKNFSLNLENNLSLVIGKNNTGKTSLLSALDKLINNSDKNKISFDDFNVELREKLTNIISQTDIIPNESEYKPLGVELKVFIEYEDHDDLGGISQLIMSLDPDDKNIILGFDYRISHTDLLAMQNEYEINKDKYDCEPILFLAENQQKYFGGVVKKSYLSTDHSIFTNLTKEKTPLNEVISFRSVSAKRNVTNKENDKTLSGQTATIYKKTEESDQQKEAVELFKKTLRTTDKSLSAIYQTMFARLLKNVEMFGGLSAAETSIKIASTLQHRELLDGNTTVMYRHDAHELPEHFNGLGYMNLISMIFEIDLLMTSFRRAATERPAALNLLFIEEPEAHTHPQMQYVFIKNIKTLLKEGQKREDGLSINLQTMISTHSSHIVAESDFDDIKYLKRADGCVSARSLKHLKKEYEGDEKAIEPTHFRFLKQYLTLNRAELFFADKAILVEGDTERILLPAMMRKLDQENPNLTPLLSQNVSIVEVGAHSQIFEKFINFIGVKALILTDFDTGYTIPDTDNNGVVKTNAKGEVIYTTRKCPPKDKLADHTSNNALTFYHGKQRKDLQFFLNLKTDEKKLIKTEGNWKNNPDGNLFTAYQTEEHGYCGRSFEDAFFSINKMFLGNDPEKFPSLIAKHFNAYIAGTCNAFEFAEKGVDKKTSLAIEILLNSVSHANSDFSNWTTPHYIQEGLEWLRN
ncbi:ATP-dependent nuclease [Pseudomonas moraviensis]|uniref:ATP-dependent nuclease n=1 Tax=Pseudomonas moraviensis TaxID=321662 RepID=UPI000F7784A1|nr:ATP-dependent endonuclease [Pseudomonas moraviensis]RRW54951.1 ATP-dependent endonuclease [Pseudomonas moraviensis]